MRNPELEMSYIDNLSSTHLRVPTLKDMIDFPNVVNRKMILDAGSGTSTCSMDLAARGATVVAFDFRYGNLEDVRETSEFDRSVTRVATALNPFDDSLRKFLEQDAVDINRFFEDIKQTKPRGTYVAGSFGTLPFRDNSFDFAYSIKCLTDYASNPEFFGDLAAELMRVIKPGGLLSIAPWDIEHMGVTLAVDEKTALAYMEQVAKVLGERGIGHRTKRGPRNFPYLELKKPGLLQSR